MEKKDKLLIHYLCEKNEYGLINAHTHGLGEYGQLDFQVVLNLNPETLKYLFGTLYKRVRAGERFQSGDLVTGIYENASILLIEMQETGRQVLRIILPDNNMLFPEDSLCATPYKFQLL